MKVSDVNPHIRFASEVYYKSKHKSVFVRDCRLFYVLSGTGEIIIENQHYSFAPNCIFYCRAGSIYSIESESGMSLVAINFDLGQSQNQSCMTFRPLDVSRENQNIKTEVCDVEDSIFLNSHFFSSGAKELFGPFGTIVEEFTAQKIYYREKCGAILKDIIIMLHRGDFRKLENAAETVSYVIEYIHNNFQKKLENKDLALLAGYHEYHLNRLFIKHTGMSLHKYILVQRMNEAKKLLLNTNIPLAEIAENIGFGNNTYFSYYFKKEFDISPSDYRRKFKNMI